MHPTASSGDGSRNSMLPLKVAAIYQQRLCTCKSLPSLPIFESVQTTRTIYFSPACGNTFDAAPGFFAIHTYIYDCQIHHGFSIPRIEHIVIPPLAPITNLWQPLVAFHQFCRAKSHKAAYIAYWAQYPI